MYKLWGLRWFLRQLSPLKVNTWLKKWKRHDNYEVSKKRDTATILIIMAWYWISVETTMLVPRWFNFGAQNSKLWPCLFFLTSPLLKIFSSIFTQLWRPITMVWNLQNSKTTTFSELPGRWLSHGTTLYRSYIFKKLSNLRFSFSSFGVFLAFSAQSSWRPIVKTLNLKVWTLPLIFLHDSTLFVIDMHQKRSISLVSTQFHHFHFHPIAGLNCYPHLISCLIHSQKSHY